MTMQLTKVAAMGTKVPHRFDGARKPLMPLWVSADPGYVRARTAEPAAWTPK